jgi:aspartate aminotransferase
MATVRNVPTQSGTEPPRAEFLSRCKPSATLVVNEKSAELVAAGVDVARFGLGQSPFPVPEHVVSALRENAYQKDYLPVAGLPALREAVAAWHRRHGQPSARTEGVFIGPGSKELLFLVQMVIDGELLVPSTAWVTYAPQSIIIGRHPYVPLPTSFETRYRLLPSVLEAHCAAGGAKPRLLILCTPGNPDGLCYTREELEALAVVCRKHNIIVLSDEIYGPLHHTNGHVSLAEIMPELSLVTGGLSKWAGAGGWRLGTLVVPKQLMWIHDALKIVASETFSAVSAPIQFAAVAAYTEHPEMEAYLEECRATLRDVAVRATQPLIDVGVKIHPPTGAFYYMADCEPMRAKLALRGITNGTQLTERMLDEIHVAVLPGVAFLRPADELSFRCAFVDFKNVDAGTARMAEWLTRDVE